MIIKEWIIDNEKVIDIFYTNQILPLVNISQDNIKIYEYLKMDQYITKGYFIMKIMMMTKLLAINSITYLRQLAIFYNLKIKLVKKKEFY